ncbi:MAG TPA: hypothetical protein VHV08_03780, partial [Pirellulales bacterium]|nr:hypothetical protein [Pirellulales bacterium]
MFAVLPRTAGLDRFPQGMKDSQVMRRARWTVAVLAAALGIFASRLAAEDRPTTESSRLIGAKRVRASEKPPVITAVAIVSGGGLVATAGDDHLVRIWSTETGRVVHLLKGHADWVRSLAFSPDGHNLASAGDDREIFIWSVSDGKLATRLPSHPQAIYSLAYNPEGTLLAAIGFEDRVRLYNPRSGTLERELQGPGPDLRSVVFSPDGS